MPRAISLPLVVATLLLQGCANHTVAVWSENEAWVYGPEGISNYSNGLQVSLSPTTPHEPCATDCSGQLFRRFVDFVNILEAKSNSPNNEIWLRYGLAQQFFTPDDITIPTIQPDDRPYAGWLSTSLDIVNETVIANDSGNTNGNDMRYRNSVGLRVGIVGPSSLGEDLQKLWHKVCDCKDPQGWDLQLGDELGFTYSLGHDRQLIRNDISDRWSYDVIGSAQAAIGNIYSGAELGGTVRLGYNLGAKWGSRTMADIGYDDSGFDSNSGFFLFAGLTGRYVARDIFVDGNTWRDSHSVDRTPFVSDQMFGMGIHWKQLELRLTMTRRTNQYRSQAGPVRFGSVVLVWKP